MNNENNTKAAAEAVVDENADTLLEVTSDLPLYPLQALLKLVENGDTIRNFKQSRSDRHMALNLDSMIELEARQFARVVPADHAKAIEMLGEDYLKGRSHCIIVSKPEKLKGNITDPRKWHGSPVIIGRKPEGDRINDGQHRAVSVDDAAKDMIRCGVDLEIDLEDVQLPVVIREGESADLGIDANTNTSKDDDVERFDNILGNYEIDSSKERRGHLASKYAIEGKAVGKQVQKAWAVAQILFATRVAFPASCKLEQKGADGKALSFDKKDYVGKSKWIGLARGNIEALGERLRDLVRFSIEYMHTPEQDVPEKVKKAFPFKATFTVLSDLTACIIADAFKTFTNASIRDQDASKREHFSAAWSKYKANGWSLQQKKKTEKKEVVKNPEAAQSVRLMVENESDAVISAADTVAKSFESGTVGGDMKSLLKAVGKAPLTLDSFLPDLIEALDPEGTGKIQQKTAHKAALKVISNVLLAYDKE